MVVQAAKRECSQTQPKRHSILLNLPKAHDDVEELPLLSVNNFLATVDLFPIGTIQNTASCFP